MKDHIREKINRATAKPRYVRVLTPQMENLDRLRKAYGMTRFDEVVAYLIEQGVKGLGEGESDAA